MPLTFGRPLFTKLTRTFSSRQKSRRRNSLTLSPTQHLEQRTLLTTGLVKNIHPTSSSTPLDLTDVNGTIFFTADDGTNGRELWKTDGTDAGTVLVKDIRPGPEDAFNPASSMITCLTNVNGTLYFVADDGVHGHELWKSDGTAAGTVLVKDINPSTGDTSSAVAPIELTNLNGTLYFYADDGTHGRELWRSDGTDIGTVMLKDINSGAFGSVIGSYAASGLRTFNGMLIFGADNGSANGEELWVSDGTPVGTVMLKDLTGDFFSSDPDDFTVVGNVMYFTAFNFTYGTELWKTDGTAAGTVLVKDITPGTLTTLMVELTAVGNTLFFAANSSATGYELWKSDGTDVGTVMVKDIRPGSSGSIDQVDDSFQNVNGLLFFAANDGISGEEIWKSDGTAAGTVRLTDIRDGGFSSYFGLSVVVGDQYYFMGISSAAGYGLWRTDAAANTVRLNDLDPNHTATPELFTEYILNVDGVLYFQGSDLWDTYHTELWRFDTGYVPPVNYAPVLDPDGTPFLPSYTKLESNTGISITDLIASMAPLGGITDANIADGQGIAIIGRNNLNGTWEFTTNGGTTWLPLGTVSTTSARLLASDANTRIRFVANSTYVGNSGITFLAWDQTAGVNGSLADTSIRGGNSPFSVKKESAYVTVLDNHAPVLNPNGNPKLPDYAQNSSTNTGTLISALIASMSPNGGITDVDQGALKGIAIVGANNVSGSWEFSTNNGSSWTPVGAATSLNARLLAANATTRIRFVPKPGFVGNSGFTFLAWDQFTGTNGGTASTAYRGLTAPFSNVKDDAFITVTGNRAPVLNPAGNPKLPNISNTATTNTGILITDLIASMSPGGGISDADSGALKGIAIIGANNVSGTWQYSTNSGSSWTNVGAATSLSARLLAANTTTRIRFVPKPGFVGTTGFTFLAWDQTAGTNGSLASTPLRGGTNPFSNAKDDAFITVTA